MTTSEIKMSEIVGNGYDEFWNCKKRYRVLKGGKASKKSTTTALNFIFRLMKEKDSNLLVVRQIMNTHRDSTFAQLKWAQEKLGVSHLWSNTVSPMEMIYKPTDKKSFSEVLTMYSNSLRLLYQKVFSISYGLKRLLRFREKPILINWIYQFQEEKYHRIFTSKLQ